MFSQFLLESDRFDDYLSRAIMNVVVGIYRAIALMIDFWGSDLNQGVFAERSSFIREYHQSDRACGDRDLQSDLNQGIFAERSPFFMV
jgi:hypothetical protein